jgi:hypothetical protein
VLVLLARNSAVAKAMAGGFAGHIGGDSETKKKDLCRKRNENFRPNVPILYVQDGRASPANGGVRMTAKLNLATVSVYSCL